MMLDGDEIGRTQKGNNNAYRQGYEISWLDWDVKDKGNSLFALARSSQLCAALTRSCAEIGS